MNIRSILSGVVIASLGIGSASFAQGHGHGHGNGNHRNHGQDVREAAHEMRDARHDLRDARQDRREARREERREERHYYNARGPEFRRGGHIPYELRNRYYVVNDWRGHHLNAPPRGYQWVQVGSDYVLAAIATGLIANLILNSR